jgi:hypothetical protein
MNILKDFVRMVFGIPEDKEVSTAETLFAIGGVVFIVLLPCSLSEL